MFSLLLPFEDVEANTVGVCCHCNSQGTMWNAARRMMTGTIAVETTHSLLIVVQFLKLVAVLLY